MSTLKDYKIFLDLDGVLANFSGKVAELMGFVLDEGAEISAHPQFIKKKMWQYINSHDWHTPFFYSLDKMKDADILFDYVLNEFDHKNVEILTASGTSPVDAPQQKIRWVRKHFGKFKVNVVSKSADKAQFASPMSILVDDRMKSIEPWISAGGTGILHVNAIKTIEVLEQLKALIRKGS